MQKTIFDIRASSLAGECLRLSRALAKARLEYLSLKLELEKREIWLAWRSDHYRDREDNYDLIYVQNTTPPELRRLANTHATVAAGKRAKSIEIRELLGNFRLRRSSLGAWHRTYLISLAQARLSDEEAGNGCTQLEDEHWWRIRWFLNWEWDNPLVLHRECSVRPPTEQEVEEAAGRIPLSDSTGNSAAAE